MTTVPHWLKLGEATQQMTLWGESKVSEASGLVNRRSVVVAESYLQNLNIIICEVLMGIV